MTEDPLDGILEEDRRYDRAAYEFVREALQHTVTGLGERRHGRVVAMQDHAVIERLVNPAAYDALNLREIEHHAHLVEFLCFQGDDRPTVVPVQVFALAFVIEQAMPIAEIDFASDSIHGGPRLYEPLAVHVGTDCNVCECS